ncbi:MAG: hypothetical protein ACYSWO_26280 [Planctomycetota bacterium]
MKQSVEGTCSTIGILFAFCANSYAGFKVGHRGETMQVIDH